MAAVASEEPKERDTSHLFVFTGITANKAGMGADKALVSKFVYERCRNSKYTQRAEDLDAKQQARTEALAAELRAQDGRMTEAEHLTEERRAHATLEVLESKRDLSRTYCVVDMDMFYAAVELRDKPHLAKRPVAIGGIGMICTANYVARLYGVRAAMPGFIAAEMVRQPHLVGSKMPPDELVFIPTDFAKYTRVAQETREIFREYDPNFHAYSLDEAYLDLTDYLASHGGPTAAESTVAEMRRRVAERTGGLTCSAGIAPNTMLAKVSSDDNKPDGQSYIPPTRDAVMEYLRDLPVRRISGVGKVCERQLKTMLDVVTCGELHAAAAAVKRAFANRPKTVDFLLRVALGLSGGETADEEGEVIGDVERKSLSSECTFGPVADRDDLRNRLQEICREVAEEMSSHVPPLAAKCIALKTKTSAFEVKTKEKRIPQYVGFDPAFGGSKRGTSSGSLGPGVSFRPDCAIPLNEQAGGSTSSACTVEEDKDCEVQISRVAADLFSIALPMLEELFPCELRLMGLRVSSFRGAQATLDKGQQRLDGFFGARTVADKTDTLEVKNMSCTASDDSGSSYAHLQSVEEVVEVVDSGDEATHSHPDSLEVRQVARPITSKAQQARASDVVCPVCGLRIPLADAERHVNAHYDDPMPLNSSVGPPKQICRTSGSKTGKKRKQRESLGPGACNLLQWSAHATLDNECILE